MFNQNLKNEIKILKTSLEARHAEIAALKADLDRMRKEKNDEIKADCYACEFVIDWDNMNAFSIERHGGDREAYTIIGYYNKEQDVSEWKFYCSQEQHNKLAKEFKNGTTKTNNSTVRKCCGTER